jgi:hypothetical protein
MLQKRAPDSATSPVNPSTVGSTLYPILTVRYVFVSGLLLINPQTRSLANHPEPGRSSSSPPLASRRRQEKQPPTVAGSSSLAGAACASWSLVLPPRTREGVAACLPPPELSRMFSPAMDLIPSGHAASRPLAFARPVARVFVRM